MITPVSILSASLVYLIPLLLGRSVWILARMQKTAYSFIHYFALGAVLFYAGVLLISIFNTKLLFGYTATLLGVSLLINLFTAHIQAVESAGKRYALPALFSVALSTSAYFMWQYNNPYGFNWDLYEHQTLVNNFINGRVSFLPSQVTDTFGFNGYSTILHSLKSAAQTVVPSDITQWWHSISLIHFGLFIFGVYLLTREVTGNRTIAASGALLSAFIFDSNISFTTLFFVPQTFTAVMFVYLFTQLLAQTGKNKLPRFGIFALSVVFLILNHYIIGVLAAAIYGATYLYMKYKPVIADKISVKRAAALLIAGTVAQALFFALVPLGFLNHGEAQSFISDLPQKFGTMRQIYGYFFPIFFVLGGIAILRAKEELQLLVLFITALLFSVVLQQAPYVMKFYVLVTGFVNLIMAIGLYSIIKRITNPGLLAGAYLFLAVALGVVFTANARVWQEALIYRGKATHASRYELDGARYLADYYEGKKILLVSDPATAHILEPFSGVNTQGGAYATAATRQTLDELSQTSDTALIARKVYEVTDKLEKEDKRLLAVSGRYFVWQQSGRDNKYALAYNVWYPADLTLENEQYIRTLQEDSQHFKLVYRNPAIAIFEVSL